MTPPKLALILGLWMCCCASSGAKSPSAPASNTADPPPAARASVLDAVDQSADLVVYIDVDELSAGPQYATVLELFSSLEGGKELHAQLCGACGFNVLEVLSEIGVSVPLQNGEPDFAAASVAAKSTRDARAVAACLAKVVPPIADAIAVREPFVVIGEARATPHATHRTNARLRPPLDYFHVRYRGWNPLAAEELVFAMHKVDGRTAFRLDVVVPTDDVAVWLLEEAGRMRSDAIADVQKLESAAQRESFLEVLKELRIDRQQNQVTARLVPKNAMDEARWLGMFTALAVQTAREYLVPPKAREAYGNVLVIAMALKAYAESQSPPRFPATAARVPAQVPRGTPYQSVASDWQGPGWQQISFGMDKPQYYAYEFETGSDGLSAVVRAVGDLDGDGVQSHFELDLHVSDGEVVMGPSIREQDPQE